MEKKVSVFQDGDVTERDVNLHKSMMLLLLSCSHAVSSIPRMWRETKAHVKIELRLIWRLPAGLPLHKRYADLCTHFQDDIK